MAELVDFAECLHPWLVHTWTCRNRIAQMHIPWSPDYGRRIGTNEVYRLYASATGSRDADAAFFDAELERFRAEAARRAGAPFEVVAQGRSRAAALTFVHFNPPDYTTARQACQFMADRFGATGHERDRQAALRHHERMKTYCRLYLNLADPISVSGLRAMAAMVLYKYRYGPGRPDPNIVKGKIAGPGMDPDRPDRAIVWFKNDRARWAFTKGLLEFMPECAFRDDLAPGIQRVAPGVGWAGEPPESGKADEITTIWRSQKHSYGSYIAGALFLALEDVRFGAGHGRADFLDRVRDRFRALGISQMQPYRICRS